MVEITNKDYDNNILKEGEEFQIDNYYEPKATDMKRRVIYVMSKLMVAPLMKVLDLGCGVGTFAFRSAKAGAMAYGVDYSEESINMARKLCEKFNVKPDFIVADTAETLPYDDNYFERIACVDFIEHISDENKVQLLKEIKRILKPGGIAVIYTPNNMREKIGEIIMRLLRRYKENPLHFGLIYRRRFERMMIAEEISFTTSYFDPGRPYLAYIPLFRGALALNLLWTIRKK